MRILKLEDLKPNQEVRVTEEWRGSLNTGIGKFHRINPNN